VTTAEPAVDPQDDQRHIERQREGEKSDRVKEGLVAHCDHWLFDLVDRHGNPEQLVMTVAGRNLDNPTDVASAGDIVEKVSGGAALPICRQQAGGSRIFQLGQLRQRWHGPTVLLQKRRQQGLVRICDDPA